MTDTPRLWDRRADETHKSYASSGSKNTTVKHWLRWSAFAPGFRRPLSPRQTADTTSPG